MIRSCLPRTIPSLIWFGIQFQALRLENLKSSYEILITGSSKDTIYLAKDHENLITAE